MKQALIIHGAYGTPQENWFPWLKKELEIHGYTVNVPQFPTPKDQNLEKWLGLAEPYYAHLHSETLLVGHSIGATFILSLLEKLPESSQPSMACLVAGFIDDLPDEDLNAINRSFYQKQFNWNKIRRNTFLLYHSPNDPFVPIESAQRLSDQLHQPLRVIANAGHFNSNSGYNQFPRLLQDILHSNI